MRLLISIKKSVRGLHSLRKKYYSDAKDFLEENTFVYMLTVQCYIYKFQRLE